VPRTAKPDGSYQSWAELSIRVYKGIITAQTLSYLALPKHMVHLVASSVHIPQILSQNALNRQMPTAPEVFETADAVILLAKLDFSNHNGQYVSIYGNDIPELPILGHV